MADEPNDPISKLSESAVQMHEWFTSLVNAGFTETQAITLMASVIRPDPT